MVVGSNPVAVTSPSDFAPASSKEFLDIQATTECGFTLKRVRDMIKTYSLTVLFSLSQMKRLQKFGGCDYKDNTRITLDKLFSGEMMSEINKKGNDKKIGITDTEILKVIAGKLLVY